MIFDVLVNLCHSIDVVVRCRYKIYAEGYAWSVSLKYILACGSMSLIIDPEYQDFFSRGLKPKHDYWPVRRQNLCPSIKSAVEWGSNHSDEVLQFSFLMIIMEKFTTHTH